MAYSSAALTSAMNKSLYFKNIFEKPSGNTFILGNFEYRGYYKITILSETTTVIFEFSQGKLISAQSVSSSRLPEEEYIISIQENLMISSERNSLVSIYGLKTDKDTVFSITVEFSGGEFILDPQVQNVILEGEKCNFNTTKFSIGILTSDINATGFNVETLTAESLFIKEIQFGDWSLSSDLSSGQVSLKLRDNS